MNFVKKMTIPKNLEASVSKSFLIVFLKRNHNRAKSENGYRKKPQVAVGDTDHTIATAADRVIDRRQAM